LKASWLSVSCKSVTKMNDSVNNYLITITWDGDSKSIIADKDLALKTLKEKLNITSKS
jgi:hypothetical protein